MIADMHPDEALMQLENFDPACTPDGLFQPVQCFHRNNTMCHCVDIYTGRPLRGKWQRSHSRNMNCSGETALSQPLYPTLQFTAAKLTMPRYKIMFVICDNHSSRTLLVLIAVASVPSLTCPA